MGLDFIRRSAPSFKKSWNNGRKELATPNLFTRTAGARSRSVVAKSDESSEALSPGSQITVASSGSELVMLKGNRRVGAALSAPADVIKGIKEAGGVAVGTVGTYHPLSKSFDVELK
jgi:hypothetical protein